MPRRPLAALVVLVVVTGVLTAVLSRSAERASGLGTPLLASPNVTLAATLPGTAAISGVFSRSAPYFYVSGVDSLSVIDVADPRRPRLVGKLVNAVFENEAMTLGERRQADGSIQRFVLVGNDLGQVTVSPAGIKLGRVGGRQLTIVDVTDPAAPRIAGQTPSSGDGAATTSTHTVACMDAACSVAYTAGDEEGFSILDLSDLSRPRELGTVPSPAGRRNPSFGGGAGHHWNVDGAGIAWHTGSGGTAAFDISDPRAPRPLNGTDERGTASPYNDFIHHNSQRPNARAFRPGTPPGVERGNVVLVTEEDYANDGDEVACDRAGTFQTWELPDLDGAAYAARNPGAEANQGTMRPLDTINPPNDPGGGLSTPAGAFCSAHWFDFHPSGIVAQGFYQQGLRLIDVRNPRDLQQFGFFTGGATQVWDAYWAPERDATGAVVPGRKTNLVFTTDVAQGVQVFEVSDLPPDLPGTVGDTGDRGTFPAAAPGALGATGPAAPASGLAGSRDCGAPSSRVSAVRLRRGAVLVRGTARARGAGCRVARVRVAVGRRVRGGCRWLEAAGTLGPRTACDRPRLLDAAGTGPWTLRRRARLPRGRYVVLSQALDTSGRAQRIPRRRAARRP